MMDANIAAPNEAPMTLPRNCAQQKTDWGGERDVRDKLKK